MAEKENCQECAGVINSFTPDLISIEKHAEGFAACPSCETIYLLTPTAIIKATDKEKHHKQLNTKARGAGMHFCFLLRKLKRYSKKKLCIA